MRQDTTSRNITVAKDTDGTVVDLTGTRCMRTAKGLKDATLAKDCTEAVTGAQLFSTNEKLTGVEAGVTQNDKDIADNEAAATKNSEAIAANATDIANNTGDIADNKVAAVKTTHDLVALDSRVGKRLDQLDQKGMGFATDTTGDGSDRASVRPGSQAVAAGSDAQANAQNSVAVGAGSRALAAGSIALGANAYATAEGSVAIGDSSQAARAQTVSVGSVGAERQIVNVAPGTEDTDAVNLGQVRGMSNQPTNCAVTQANSYTDSRIKKLRREANAGIASAMAAGVLPTASTPGKSMIAMGTAAYGGESAIAAGFSARSESGAWTYRVSGTTTSRGDVGAAVWVGFEW